MINTNTNEVFNNTLDLARLQEIKAIQQENYKVMAECFAMSQYIESKGLQGEFNAQRPKINLVNFEQLASTSYENSMGSDLSEDKAITEVNSKAYNLYNVLKDSIPSELHGILLRYSDLQGDACGITEEVAYKRGYTDAIKMINEMGGIH